MTGVRLQQVREEGGGEGQCDRGVAGREDHLATADRPLGVVGCGVDVEMLEAEPAGRARDDELPAPFDALANDVETHVAADERMIDEPARRLAAATPDV